MSRIHNLSQHSQHIIFSAAKVQNVCEGLFEVELVCSAHRFVTLRNGFAVIFVAFRLVILGVVAQSLEDLVRLRIV